MAYQRIDLANTPAEPTSPTTKLPSLHSPAAQSAGGRSSTSMTSTTVCGRSEPVATIQHEGNVPPAVRSSVRLEPPLACAACTEQPGDPAGYCVASQGWGALRLAPTYDFAVHGREIELLSCSYSAASRPGSPTRLAPGSRPYSASARSTRSLICLPKPDPLPIRFTST